MKSLPLKQIFPAALALGLVGAVTAGETMSSIRKDSPKSLVIMLDGVRADAMQGAATPFLDKLLDQGWLPEYKVFYSCHARPVADAPTDSAPNHAAIATGVTAEKHLVQNNDMLGRGNYRKYPSFLRHIAEKTGEKTVFCYLWREDCFLAPHDRIARIQTASDEKNCEEMLKLLRSDAVPPALLWFIDAPDLGGHRSGFYPFGPLYLAALNQCDKYLEAVFQALRDRREFPHEDWLIVITSDHGGIAGTHGPRGTQLETLPFIAVGKNIPAGYGCNAISNFDCAALVLAHHGIDASALELDAKLPVWQTVAPLKTPPLRRETFDSPDFDGIAGMAESGFRQGFRNGALRLKDPAARANVPLPARAHGGDKSFSCSFYLNPDDSFHDGRIWQFGDLKLQYSDGKVFLNGKRAGTDVRIGEFDCVPQRWQLAVITADRAGNITLGWGAADGFFYFASAAVDLPAAPAAMILGQGFVGRIDELLFFDRTVTMRDFGNYHHTLRTGGEYRWQ